MGGRVSTLKGASTNKGLFYKTNAQGEKVMRTRAKYALGATAATVLLTPQGHSLAKNAAGAAADAAGTAANNAADIFTTLFGDYYYFSSISSVLSICCCVLAIVMMVFQQYGYG